MGQPTLIGVDTNVLLRHLVQLDPREADQAALFLERQRTRGRRGFIDRVVLAELVWVLGRSYRFEREWIAATIELWLRTDELVVEDADDVARALHLYRDGIDLMDALIGLSNARQGCSATATLTGRRNG